jgi:transcriptional regulator with GAF, ATPase, and Fis domain
MFEPLEIRIERDGASSVIRLPGETALVGRGSDCDVRLEDPLASRNHCRFERLGREVFVVDLGSANGTWVDGVKIDRRSVGPHHAVRIGGTVLRLVGSFAERLAAAESTQTQQVSREREMLDIVLSVARALEQEERAERVAALLIDAAVSLTRAERGFVFLLEDGRTSLALGRNFAREVVAAPETKISRTLLQKALLAPRPTLLQDAASDGEFAGVASISDLGLRSLLAVPLRGAGRVLGLLLVDHRLASGAFREDDVALLAGIAAHAGIHLASAQDRRESHTLRRRLNALQRELGRRVQERDESSPVERAASTGLRGLVGASPAMQKLAAEMERILRTEVPVLIHGESGTGKELVARALHEHGLRANRAFVVENCGALPDTLLESELFGHVKGAFTGASRDRIGRFEEADGGTLFLDEVGETSEAMQARLLRVIQEGEIRRVGSNEILKVDVRIIAATNVDLMERVRANRFREDLYYRLKVVGLEMPPLRERHGDVRLLAEHFLDLEAAATGRLARVLTPETLSLLETYPWPGNVRELLNEMRRLSLMGEGPVRVDDLSAEVRAGAGAAAAPPAPGRAGSLPERLAAMEVAALKEALLAEPQNRSRAAQRLGITRFALQRKLEKYGLETGGNSPALPADPQEED